MGSLAIGLGTADVTMPLITGETWFHIPESVSIRLEGKPGPGIGGKDVILYILQQLKRNTVAAERVVEFSGPGLKHLSCDARFAIANMCTEFGGVTGIFIPDEVTKSYIERRKSPKHKRGSTYFRPDDDAEYAESRRLTWGTSNHSLRDIQSQMMSSPSAIWQAFSSMAASSARAQQQKRI